MHSTGKAEEVKTNDEGSGDDKKPMVELGPAGLATGAATAGAGTVEQAAKGTMKMVAGAMKENLNNADDLGRLAKTFNGVGTIAEGASKTSTGLGIAGVGISVIDGLTNEKGWQNHHTADEAVGTALVLIGSNPVGWGLGLIYFGADLITRGVTGKSITENLFD